MAVGENDKNPSRPDGKVQTVMIKTIKGEYTRPVVKMVHLVQQDE